MNRLDRKARLVSFMHFNRGIGAIPLRAVANFVYSDVKNLDLRDRMFYNSFLPVAIENEWLEVFGDEVVI